MSFDGNIILTAETATFTAGVFTDSFTVGGSDVDMVKIEFEAGRTYRIDIDNLSSADFYLRVFDANGNEVRANDDGSRSDDDVVLSVDPFVDFIPNYSGVYYIAISAYYLDSYDPFTTNGRNNVENPLAASTGQLTVTDFGVVNFPGANAIGPSGLTAEGINDETDVFRDQDRSLRVQYKGAFEFASDVDIGRIDLVKNDIMVVDVNGEAGTVIRVFNSAGTQIGFDDDTGTGDDAELIFAIPLTSTYYIGLSGEGNTAYNVIDGTGAVAGAVGDYEVIIHRNPTLIGTAVVNAFAGTGQDDYIVSLAGNDQVSGADGEDTLAGGDDSDILNGGRGNDVLYGESGDDTLVGSGGQDILSGGLGVDSLNGSGGNDSLSGDAGDDNLVGGGGNDTHRGGDGNDSLVDTAGNDDLRGDAGDDTLAGGIGNDRLDGGANDDTLNGGKGLDTLLGGDGVDALNGDDDNDTLDGGGGNDNLSGGIGNDVLAGAGDDDTLAGGAGDDAFDFDNLTSGVDTILDFVLAGGDVIDLSSIFDATGSVVTGANLAQFIQVSPAGVADSFLAVDANGVTGGLTFTIIAQVAGITNVQLFDVANFIL